MIKEEKLTFTIYNYLKYFFILTYITNISIFDPFEILLLESIITFKILFILKLKILLHFIFFINYFIFQKLLAKNI